MIYSKTCEYAIRSLAYMAHKGRAASVTADEVSRYTRVPAAYVAKIFQGLVRAKILGSRRGPKGGFTFAADPEKLSVLEVIRAVEDPVHSSLSGCVMGLNICNDSHPCPLHFIWKDAKQLMLERLEGCTLGEVAKIGGKFKSGKHRRFTLSKKMRGVFKLS